MADILAQAKEKLTSLVQTEADKLKAKYGQKDGSAAKPPQPSKETKKEMVSPQSMELADFSETILTQGYSRHPVVNSLPKDVKPADYYRRGLYKKTEAGKTTPGSKQYDYTPRFLDEADDQEASIRVYGPSISPTSYGTATAAEKDLIPPFTKFILESVQEGHQERSQVVETFGDFYVFFFGERPPIYTYNGTLINAKSINWVDDFVFYYENFLRGTKCVEKNARLVLTYGQRQVEAYLLGFNMNTQAPTEKGVAVSFSALIIDRKVLRLSKDFGIMEENGIFKEDKNFIQLLMKGQSGVVASAAVAETKKVMSAAAAPVSPAKKKKNNAPKPPASTQKSTSSGVPEMLKRYDVPAQATPSGGVTVDPDWWGAQRYAELPYPIAPNPVGGLISR